MKHIVLNDEQMKVLAEAQRHVEVRDSDGHLVGYLQFVGFAPADLAEAEQHLASNEPRYTTEQVLAHLRSLESK